MASAARITGLDDAEMLQQTEHLVEHSLVQLDGPPLSRLAALRDVTLQ
jgi:hypothetical protein